MRLHAVNFTRQIMVSRVVLVEVKKGGGKGKRVSEILFCFPLAGLIIRSQASPNCYPSPFTLVSRNMCSPGCWKEEKGHLLDTNSQIFPQIPTNLLLDKHCFKDSSFQTADSDTTISSELCIYFLVETEFCELAVAASKVS